MSASVFGAAAAVTMLNRAFNNASPANAVFNNQVATAGTTEASQFAFATTFAQGFASLSNADLASRVMGNLGMLPNDALLAAFTDYLAANGAESRGVIVLQLSQILSTMENATGDLAIYAPQAVAWNKEVEKSFVYSSTTSNTTSYNGDFPADGANPGGNFTLTSATAVLTDTTSNGVTPSGRMSAGDDKVDALNLLASTTIVKDIYTNDNDTLSAIVSAAVKPLLTNIETVDVTFTDAAGNLQTDSMTGTKNISVNGSTSTAGKISGLSATAAPTITLGATTQVVTVAQTTDAGTTDVLNVALAGSKGGLTLNDGTAGGSLETLNIASGTSANKLTVAVDGTNTVGVTKTVVTGASDLTLVGAADGQISGTAKFAAIDASAHTGALTLQVGALSSDATITDTAIALTNYKGVDKVVLNSNVVVSVTGASSGIAVDLNSDFAYAGAFTLSGSTAVADAASNADVATINLTGSKTAGTSSNLGSTLTFTGFETLNIKSTGIAHTITGALTTAGSATALDTVNISGDKDLTLTAAPSGVEKIDATGFTGKLTMGAAGASLLVLTGGDGNDTLYTGGNATSATVVNGGAGNDTFIFGANTDNVTGGAGADIFNVSTLANVVLADNDVIADFTSGTDTLKVGATMKAATTAATLTVQELAWNTDLSTTIGAGAYATIDAAYLVKVNNAGGVAGASAYYAVLNDGTAGFIAANDGLVKLTGVTALTTADFIA